MSKLIFIPDEAEAVLTILACRKAGKKLSEKEWQSLFTSEGFKRLQQREHSMGMPFSDDDFRAFVLSDDLLQVAESLSSALNMWLKMDLNEAASRALAYLPDDAQLVGKIYPVIKPKPNSFVFESETNPAIFLYLDPKVSTEKLLNTVTHELHHIGHARYDKAVLESDWWKTLPPQKRATLEWIFAFKEGLAMLAAAGGPNIHPHASSCDEDRARWDRDLENLHTDIRKLEQFFLDVLNGRLIGETVWKAGFAFFGEQGPWYTVGWQMAVVIEQQLGRKALIDASCDPRQLLRIYNESARERNEHSKQPLPLWSKDLVEALS